VLPPLVSQRNTSKTRAQIVYINPVLYDVARQVVINDHEMDTGTADVSKRIVNMYLRVCY